MNHKPHYLKGKLISVKRSRYCPKDSSQDRNFNFPQNWMFAHRLPNKESGEVWQHTHNFGGEKHRMRFCTSENITLMGIGLLVHSTIGKISFNICQKMMGDVHNPDHNVIFQQDFDNVNGSSMCSILLKLRHGVQLSCDHIYLLVLTVHGGASYVGYGGEEFVVVQAGGGEQGEDVKNVLFKFEDYKHSSTQVHKTTDQEKGLVEKIYFEM